MAKPTETEPTVELDATGDPAPTPPEPFVDAAEEPEREAAQWGYCHNPDCVVNAMQVFHPVGQPGPDTAGDQFSRPHMCADLTHPHPVMCQCGELLSAEPVEGSETAEDTLVKDDD